MFFSTDLGCQVTAVFGKSNTEDCVEQEVLGALEELVLRRSFFHWKKILHKFDALTLQNLVFTQLIESVGGCGLLRVSLQLADCVSVLQGPAAI